MVLTKASVVNRTPAGEGPHASPNAVAHGNRLIHVAASGPLAAGLALERTLFLEVMLTDDAPRPMRAMNHGERDIRV